MVQDIGMGAADPRGHGLQRHGLGAKLDQQFARRLQCNAATFDLR